MTTVDFAISGTTGFMVLQNHADLFGAGAVGNVTVYEGELLSASVNDDITMYCTAHNLKALSSTEIKHAAGNFCFVVGWPVKPCPNEQLIIFHEGLLPRFRGFAPLVNALISGEREIGVTAIIGSGENDSGPVLQQEKTFIDYPLKIKAALAKVVGMHILIATSLFKKLAQKAVLVTMEQDHYLASYCLEITEQDYAIDWTKPAEQIKRTIDAVDEPYRGAVAKLNGKPIHINEVRIVGEVAIENRRPGKVIFMQNGHPVIVCGQGLLAITSACILDSNEPIMPFVNLESFFS